MGIWAALLAVAAGLGLYVWWRRIAVLPPPRWSEARAYFQNSQVKGDFGELLTAVILTQQGWRQLPSKLDAHGHGLDGLFLRRGLLGQRILITESKVNASRYKPAQLDNTKLIRALGDLYAVGVLDWQTSAAIIRALKWRSPALRKELWRHSLHQGRTTITRANRHGALARRGRSHDTAALMESLAMMLGQMDREGLYLAPTG